MAGCVSAALGLQLAGCGGSDADPSPAPSPAPPPPPSPPPPPPPPPPAPTSLSRLKAALARPQLRITATPVLVSQGLGNAPVSSLGSGAQVWPPLVNPGAASLATIPEVWGFKRDRWTVGPTGSAVIAGQAVYPVTRSHRSATLGSEGVCGLHFEMQGRAFEVLFAGLAPSLTVVFDGQYMSEGVIQTSRSAAGPGASLSQPNTFVKIDFGSAVSRRVSLYARSSQGPCAIALAAGDSLRPWDRSDEASVAFMADSYGGAFGPNWGVSGPFWEAAALLGIPHVDIDAVGGTGYAPSNVPGFTNPGDSFPARLPSSVDTMPDLFVTAGGINDNIAFALPPYATAEEARVGFTAAVNLYYAQLRAALPQSVLVALAPWAPRQVVPTDPVTQAKVDVTKAALRAAGGTWVFIDNLNGGWVCSNGAQSVGDGPWQTGTGNEAAPTGVGNGDRYLAFDGVHPNPAGCLYLGTRLAAELRQALTTF